MNTDEFRLTVGRAPGYDHGNDPDLLATVREVATAWQGLMTAEGESSGVYPSAVLHEGLVVYANEHGCPKGGESVAVLYGTRNPKYAPYSSSWKGAVLRVAEKLRRKLGQVTATLSFSAAEVHHLADDVPVVLPEVEACKVCGKPLEYEYGSGLTPWSAPRSKCGHVTAPSVTTTLCSTASTPPPGLRVTSPYGYCPRCGAPGAARERRPNGNDNCPNGHTYPSRDAIDDPALAYELRNKP